MLEQILKCCCEPVNNNATCSGYEWRRVINNNNLNKIKLYLYVLNIKKSDVLFSPEYSTHTFISLERLKEYLQNKR